MPFHCLHDIKERIEVILLSHVPGQVSQEKTWVDPAENEAVRAVVCFMAPLGSHFVQEPDDNMAKRGQFAY